MSIIIKKEANGYSAIIQSPNSHKIEWKSERPMSSSALMQKLCDIGHHQIDVIDAFNAADPQWLNVGGPD